MKNLEDKKRLVGDILMELQLNDERFTPDEIKKEIKQQLGEESAVGFIWQADTPIHEITGKKSKRIEKIGSISVVLFDHERRVPVKFEYYI